MSTTWSLCKVTEHTRGEQKAVPDGAKEQQQRAKNSLSVWNPAENVKTGKKRTFVSGSWSIRLKELIRPIIQKHVWNVKVKFRWNQFGVCHHNLFLPEVMLLDWPARLQFNTVNQFKRELMRKTSANRTTRVTKRLMFVVPWPGSPLPPCISYPVRKTQREDAYNQAVYVTKW